MHEKQIYTTVETVRFHAGILRMRSHTSDPQQPISPDHERSFSPAHHSRKDSQSDWGAWLNCVNIRYLRYSIACAPIVKTWWAWKIAHNWHIKLSDYARDRAGISRFALLTVGRHIKRGNHLSSVSLRNSRTHLPPEPSSTATCQKYRNQQCPTLERCISPCSFLVQNDFDIQALTVACCLGLVALLALVLTVTRAIGLNWPAHSRSSALGARS